MKNTKSLDNFDELKISWDSMRIGFFTETFLPQVNGVVTALNDFGKELAERGHTVHIFCPSSSYKGVDYGLRGIHVHTFPSVSFRLYPDYRVGMPLSLKRVPQLDIVHTHSPFLFGWYGLRAAKNQKLPCISTFHTLIPEFSQYVKIPPSIYKRFSWAYMRMHYKKYNALTTPSFAIKNILEEHGFERPITVLPNGIDTKFFHRVKNAREKLCIDADRIYLYVGRLSHEKHIEIILRASKRFLGGNDRLIIIGKGPADSYLRNLVKNDRRIIFTGYVEQNALPIYYSASDTFITASTCETQGLTSLEAMACGCPVVGRDVLATSEVVINGKNGYLWSKQSELVGLLNVSGDAKLAKLSKRARETARQYSIPRCTDRLERFYSKLLS